MSHPADPLQAMSAAPAEGFKARLRLIYSRCGADETAAAAFLRWLAYPLQAPGTKMPHAVAFHGPQGGGKAFIADALLRLYGQFAHAADASLLSPGYRHQILGKAFIVIDGQPDRATLADLITEDFTPTHEKNRPPRVIPCRANFLILTNLPRHSAAPSPRVLALQSEIAAPGLLDEAVQERQIYGEKPLLDFLHGIDLSKTSPWGCVQDALQTALHAQNATQAA